MEIHSNCPCTCDDVCTFDNAHRRDKGCFASLKTYNNFIAFWSSMLCSIFANYQWYNKKCLLEDCNRCGVRILSICSIELQSTNLMKWKSIGY